MNVGQRTILTSALVPNQTDNAPWEGPSVQVFDSRVGVNDLPPVVSAVIPTTILAVTPTAMVPSVTIVDSLSPTKNACAIPCVIEGDCLDMCKNTWCEADGLLGAVLDVEGGVKVGRERPVEVYDVRLALVVPTRFHKRSRVVDDVGNIAKGAVFQSTMERIGMRISKLLAWLEVLC